MSRQARPGKVRGGNFYSLPTHPEESNRPGNTPSHTSSHLITPHRTIRPGPGPRLRARGPRPWARAPGPSPGPRLGGPGLGSLDSSPPRFLRGTLRSFLGTGGGNCKKTFVWLWGAPGPRSATKCPPLKAPPGSLGHKKACIIIESLITCVA